MMLGRSATARSPVRRRCLLARSLFRLRADGAGVGASCSTPSPAPSLALPYQRHSSTRSVCVRRSRRYDTNHAGDEGVFAAVNPPILRLAGRQTSKVSGECVISASSRAIPAASQETVTSGIARKSVKKRKREWKCSRLHRLLPVVYHHPRPPWQWHLARSAWRMCPGIREGTDKGARRINF